MHTHLTSDHPSSRLNMLFAKEGLVAKLGRLLRLLGHCVLGLHQGVLEGERALQLLVLQLLLKLFLVIFCLVQLTQ